MTLLSECILRILNNKLCIPFKINGLYVKGIPKQTRSHLNNFIDMKKRNCRKFFIKFTKKKDQENEKKLLFNLFNCENLLFIYSNLSAK